jgi:hypothetical protein
MLPRLESGKVDGSGEMGRVLVSGVKGSSIE